MYVQQFQKYCFLGTFLLTRVHFFFFLFKTHGNEKLLNFFFCVDLLMRCFVFVIPYHHVPVYTPCVLSQVTDRHGWVWRLMIMPQGNSSESYGHLSVFVEHVNKDDRKVQVLL